MNKKHICKICHKDFEKICNLKSHTLCHTGERPFSCTWENCNKKFTRNSDVKRHIRSRHTGERPYECMKCHEHFVRKDVLNSHIKAVHNNLNKHVKRVRNRRGKGLNLSNGVDLDEHPIEEVQLEQYYNDDEPIEIFGDNSADGTIQIKIEPEFIIDEVI